MTGNGWPISCWPSLASWVFSAQLIFLLNALFWAGFPIEEQSKINVLGSATSSIGLMDSICNEPIDFYLHFIPFAFRHPSFLQAFHESLGDIGGFHPSFDPCCAWTYLEKQCVIPSLIILLIFL